MKSKNTPVNINYRYIWKKLNGELSEEEERVLESWLKSDLQHEQYYEMAKYYHKHGSFLYNVPVDTLVALNKLKQKLKRKAIVRYSMAVAAVFAIGLILSGIFFFPEKGKEEQSQMAQVSLLPGEKQAMLVLNDGSLHKLNQENNFEIKEENTLIKSEGNSITYESESASKKKLLYNTLIVPRGAEFFLTLSDSTKVWLNSETTLRYPVSFSKENREVELIGEAYFEVSKDANRPFHVISNNHVIEVLGTAFNLTSFKNKDEIFTTLVRGKVVIKNTEDQELSLELKPGQQAVFNRKSGNAYQREVDVSIYTSWKDGRFKFNEESLAEIMETFSRWYDIDVTFENHLARDLKFSGILKRHQNFEDIIPILESTNELKIFAYGKRIVIK